MAERKSVNKYYPKDWDPSKGTLNTMLGKHPLGKRAKDIDNGIIIVRFALAYDIECRKCHTCLVQGQRFNAKKSIIGKYMDNIDILSFEFPCEHCDNIIIINTDPKNKSYNIISGAKRIIKTHNINNNDMYDHYNSLSSIYHESGINSELYDIIALNQGRDNNNNTSASYNISKVTPNTSINELLLHPDRINELKRVHNDRIKNDKLYALELASLGQNRRKLHEDYLQQLYNEHTTTNTYNTYKNHNVVEKNINDNKRYDMNMMAIDNNITNTNIYNNSNNKQSTMSSSSSTNNNTDIITQLLSLYGQSSDISSHDIAQQNNIPLHQLNNNNNNNNNRDGNTEFLINKTTSTSKVKNKELHINDDNHTMILSTYDPLIGIESSPLSQASIEHSILKSEAIINEMKFKIEHSQNESKKDITHSSQSSAGSVLLQNSLVPWRQYASNDSDTTNSAYTPQSRQPIPELITERHRHQRILHSVYSRRDSIKIKEKEAQDNIDSIAYNNILSERKHRNNNNNKRFKNNNNNQHINAYANILSHIDSNDDNNIHNRPSEVLVDAIMSANPITVTKSSLLQQQQQYNNNNHNISSSHSNISPLSSNISSLSIPKPRRTISNLSPIDLCDDHTLNASNTLAVIDINDDDNDNNDNDHYRNTTNNTIVTRRSGDIIDLTGDNMVSTVSDHVLITPTPFLESKILLGDEGLFPYSDNDSDD